MVKVQIEITKEYASCGVYNERGDIIFSSHRWDTESTLEFMQRMIQRVTELGYYQYIMSDIK